jgi:two-component system OmpR family response regulator
MKSILIVEDNPDIAMLYQRVYMQHHTDTVDNVHDALMLLGKNHYDLVILDMHLPGRNGMDVLEYIRAQHIETHIFAISADDSFKYDARNMGISHWMTKPIELDELISVSAIYLG